MLKKIKECVIDGMAAFIIAAIALWFLTGKD